VLPLTELTEITELSGSSDTYARLQMCGLGEAKSQLSSLVTAALADDDVVSPRSGAPVARIVPLESPQPLSMFGIASGKIPEMTDSEWEESDWALDLLATARYESAPGLTTGTPCSRHATASRLS